MTRKVFLPSYSCLNSMLLWHHGVSLRANPWAKQTDKGLESSEKKPDQKAKRLQAPSQKNLETLEAHGDPVN